MPLEVIEENQYVAQARFRCDLCGAYIGTRIILQTELAEKSKTPLLCTKCKNLPKTDKQV